MRHLARGLVLCALMAAVGPARAEPPAFPDFEARRVKPPKPGAKKRILVQITAPVPRKPVAPAPDPAVRDDGARARQPGVPCLALRQAA